MPQKENEITKKFEQLDNLIYSIKTDIEERDTDDRTIEMCNDCLNIIEGLKEKIKK